MITQEKIESILSHFDQRTFFSSYNPEANYKLIDHFVLTKDDVTRFASKYNEEMNEFLSTINNPNAKSHNRYIDAALEVGDLVLCHACHAFISSCSYERCVLNKIYLIQEAKAILSRVMIPHDISCNKAIVSRLLDQITNKWIICELLYNSTNVYLGLGEIARFPDFAFKKQS